MSEIIKIQIVTTIIVQCSYQNVKMHLNCWGKQI